MIPTAAESKPYAGPAVESIGLSPSPVVSAVIPAWNEGKNVGPLVTRISQTLAKLVPLFEVIIVDGGSQDDTWEQAERAGARCILQRRVGYGGALREGLAAARGEFIVTMDSDLSHPPELIEELWKFRDEADVVVASRFVGGSSQAPFGRKVLSIILNWIFAKVLTVPIKDSSSGYRLYRRRVVEPQQYTRENFNILQEVLVRAFSNGFSIKEVPLHYEPRAHGESHVSLVKFALSYLPTLYRLWMLRNTPEAADYESRAGRSRHLLQRLWINKRSALIREFIKGTGAVLDLGSGSAPHLVFEKDVVALDCNRAKLRFQRGARRATTEATVAALPFTAHSFSRVLLSQVLPYVESVEAVLAQVNTILTPGGVLVLSVPDAKRMQWRIVRALYRILPNIQAVPETQEIERRGLIDALAESGFRVTKYRYIFGAELVIRAVKVAEV